MGTRQLNITLSEEMAELLQRKVASGRYLSESEALSAGLRALHERDEGHDAWLRAEIGPAYDAHKADPKAGKSWAEAKAELEARMHRHGAGR